MPVSIEERKNRDHSVTYRVRWRDHTGRPTYTFNTARLGPAAGALADRFAQLVGAAGDRLPDPAALALFGLAWILPVDGQPSTAPNYISDGGPVTVAGACTAYLDWLAASADPPTARTLDDYRDYVRLYIAPRPLGQRAITDPAVTFHDVDQWQRELATTVAPGGRIPLGPNSISKVRAGVLAPALDWACSPRSSTGQDLTPLRSAANPMTYSVAPGHVDPAPRDILRSPADYALFTRCAYAVDRNWADWVVTVAATGLRDGEAAMVAAGGVDPDRGTLTVIERYTGGRVEPGGKNGRRRDIPIPTTVLDRCVRPRLDRAGQLLFTGPRGGRWAYATAADRWAALRRELAAAGLRRHLTPHSLRHSYNTALTGADIHPVKIDLVMGHDSSSMRHTYNQLTDTDLARMRTVLDPLFADGW